MDILYIHESTFRHISERVVMTIYSVGWNRCLIYGSPVIYSTQTPLCNTQLFYVDIAIPYLYIHFSSNGSSTLTDSLGVINAGT